MIDTDKYGGHTPGQWSVTSIRDGSIPWNTADEELCADAPLLLAEVKRLREGRLDLINEVIRIINNKTGERVDADLHDYIIDRLVNE
tara:strand:- start:2766 stop:3026 length:261 start_codon:yes stop_codon:yes gene_type:complete